MAENLIHSQIIKMKPSDGNKLKKIAYSLQMPVNRLLNIVVTDYINQHMDLVEQYDKFFTEPPKIRRFG